MRRPHRHLPLYLQAEDYDRLAALAVAEDRDVWAQARHILRVALREEQRNATKEDSCPLVEVTR